MVLHEGKWRPSAGVQHDESFLNVFPSRACLILTGQHIRVTLEDAPRVTSALCSCGIERPSQIIVLLMLQRVHWLAQA